MALLSKFLFTAKMVLSFYIAAIATNQNQFVYLNMPETLIKPGIVHKKQFTKNTKARYFVHFKNGTNSSQSFTFKSQYNVENFRKSSTPARNILPPQKKKKSANAKTQGERSCLACSKDVTGSMVNQLLC